MRIPILTVLTLVLLLSACAGPAADTSAPSSAPSPTAPADVGASAATRTVTGVLGGDAQLEGGCVWLETDQGQIEVIWPAGYTVSADPVELRDDGGDVVATAGEEVEITGAPATDRVSTCQVGEIWTAVEVRSG